MNTKKNLRNQYLKQRLGLNSHAITQNSNKIVSKLKEEKFLPQNIRILGFYPIKNEPNLTNFYKYILEKKSNTLYFPKIFKDKIKAVKINNLNDLVPTPPYNIPEPKPNTKIATTNDIDVVLVPGIVFDKQGHRIGFGKGFYDRFLKKGKLLNIGIAYDFQVVDKIPAEEHDVPVDKIITPTKTISIISS